MTILTALFKGPFRLRFTGVYATMLLPSGRAEAKRPRRSLTDRQG